MSFPLPLHATTTYTMTNNHHKHSHHGDHDHDHDHHHKHPIRYFKLSNHGAAVIHFLIKDKANGRTVFEGGPTLTAGQSATIDLSSTPGIHPDTSYTFGAFVTAGKNATDHHPQKVDFGSELVGVWKWTGTTVAGSKVHFEGYEKYQPEEMGMEMGGEMWEEVVVRRGRRGCRL